MTPIPSGGAQNAVTAAFAALLTSSVMLTVALLIARRRAERRGEGAEQEAAGGAGEERGSQPAHSDRDVVPKQPVESARDDLHEPWAACCPGNGAGKAG